MEQRDTLLLQLSLMPQKALRRHFDLSVKLALQEGGATLPYRSSYVRGCFSAGVSPVCTPSLDISSQQSPQGPGTHLSTVSPTGVL